jgi:hypothetical protein
MVGLFDYGIGEMDYAARWRLAGPSLSGSRR